MVHIRSIYARLITAILALLLPIKIMAATMMPIMGQAGHHESAHDTAFVLVTQSDTAIPNDEVQTFSDHTVCEGHNPHSAHNGIHEHACPHLGLALLCMTTPNVTGTHAIRRIKPITPQPLRSVVLDVPTQPPRHA